MANRPRIQWQELVGDIVPAVWTPGWLPDTDVLRWSLANHFRVEGICDGWAPSYAQADAVTIREAYVAEDEDGDWVEVSPTGVAEVDGTAYTNFRPATVARLHPPT